MGYLLPHIFMNAVRFLHNLPHAQNFVIVGSCAAAFQGALGRFPNDIDVLVTSKAAWQWLVEQFGPPKFVQTGPYNGFLIVAEYISPQGKRIEVEFTQRWQFQEPQAGCIAPREEQINGIKVACARHVTAAKAQLGRIKDAEDIVILERCLKPPVSSIDSSKVAQKVEPTIIYLEKPLISPDLNIITPSEPAIIVPEHRAPILSLGAA